MNRTLIASLVAVGVISVGVAQEPGAKRREARAALKRSSKTRSRTPRWRAIFTIDGRQDDKPPHKDVYKIESCKKSGGDVWIVTAFIGHSNVKIPIRWRSVGREIPPMIMLTDVGAAGNERHICTATCSSTATLRRTSSHDKVGGHMWGKLGKSPAESKDKEGK